MSCNNTDMPCHELPGEQNYFILPYLNQCEDFCPYFSQEDFSHDKRVGEESVLAAVEVSSSSDFMNGQADHSSTEDDSDIKKQLRRIQNREAASRCRRRKMERISFLRQTLHRMYNRCQELRQNINAVEAQVRELKAAGYGQHLFFGQHEEMKNGVFEQPMTDLSLFAGGGESVMGDQLEPQAENHY